MATQKTTDPSQTPAGPATPPESGAQKGRELGDDELDKVAGGFGINMIASALATSMNNFKKALPGILEAADKPKPKTDSK